MEIRFGQMMDDMLKVIIGLLILASFGIWKIVELIIYICQHITWQ